MKKHLLLFALLLLISGAMFGQDEYNITYSPDSSHTFNGCYLWGDGTATAGDTVTVNIHTESGYELASISAVDGNEQAVTLSGSGSTRTFIMPANNVTVNATFTTITYNITYILNGGELPPGQSNPETYTIETPTFTLNNPTKEGYNFNGWTGTDLTDPTQTVTINQGSTGNREYIANWTPINYNITYILNGGELPPGQSNPETYTIETPDFTLNNPTKEGYNFNGWTGTNLTEPTQTVTINQGSMGNRTYTANWTPINYNISYILNGGELPPGQSNPETYTIETPTFTLNNPTKEGYNFNGWTGTDLTDPTQTVTINQGSMGNRTYTANWTPITYTINVSANPSNGGNVTGGGDYSYGQNCTVTATANQGYTFTKWTENGTQVSTNANYTFPVEGSRNLVAHFTMQDYVITVQANPTNGGIVSGGGGYNYGQSCTLTATPAQGYEFVKWTKNGGQVSTNPTYTFTVTGSATYVAHFQIQSYTITASANPSNGGSVSGGDTYFYGQNCTLTATPANGYTFIGWTENGNSVSTNASYTFTVTGNRTLIAQFQTQSYSITASANPANGGTVSGGGGYNYGQSCTLTATPAQGYEFVKWTKNGGQVSTNPTYTFTVTESATYVAHFQAQTYTITASANPSNGGTVTGGGPYSYGQNCTVVASASTGYTFLKWTENSNPVSTNASYTFTVTGNRTLIAQFQAQTYTITATANPSNGGTVSGGGQYNYGQSCTLTAAPAAGYNFSRWTKNGQQVSTNLNYTFTVTESASYVAHFTQQNCTINVSADPTDGGTVSGGGSYNYGQPCTVHANANGGYTFVNWTENGSQVSTSSDYTFTVYSSRILVAHFTQQEYIITAEADPEDGGIVEGSGGYDHGDECTLTAIANEGYNFINWTKNGLQVSNKPSFNFIVTMSATYVAHFQKKSFTITATADPTNGGTVSGDGTYDYGENCTLTAISADGYTFTNWTEDNNSVSTNAEYTFIVTSNHDFVAHFQIQQYIIKTEVDPVEGGSVEGGGGYSYGDECTLTATANDGYDFVKWTKLGDSISVDSTYSFRVVESATYVAHFQKKNYIINVEINPADGGMVEGAGTHPYGEQVTLKAIPNSGYAFVKWSDENGNQISTNSTCIITVTGNRTLVANFIAQQQGYTITIPESLEGGTVTVSQNLSPQGTTITITINVDEGCELDTIAVYGTEDPQQPVEVTQTAQESNYEFIMPGFDVTVMVDFRLHIDTPDAICSGQPLDLAEPWQSWILSGSWQLSQTRLFEQPETYNIGEPLDASYNDWYLRYQYKTLLGNIRHSNIVQITVHSLAEMTLQGNESISINQEATYRIDIDGINDYSGYSFNWSVSDEQAITTETVNNFKVIWKTAGEQQVSVIVTDNTTSCTDTLNMNVNVTSCIDNLQEIVAKKHATGNNDTIVLILVYPNPNNESFTYQWLYSNKEIEGYTELNGATGQYYYKKGGLDEGFYKVRITKNADCSVETLPYHVENSINNLRIYPNPTRRGNSIVVVNDCDGPAQLTIYSTDGRLLHTQTVTDSQAIVNINLPQGVYVAYLTNSDGYKKVGKLIIQ